MKRFALPFLFFAQKIFWGKARIIRITHRIRGRKYIKYGKRSINWLFMQDRSVFNRSGKPTNIFGENVLIGDYAHIVGNYHLTIGDNVLIASRVFISDTSHGNYKNPLPDSPLIPPNQRELHFSKVEIGNNVWIWENVCILPGVKIGDGSIVGAGSVVTKSFPNDVTVSGNQAGVIKCFDKRLKIWVRV